MTTSDDRVQKLIDFINVNAPNQYDYPVHDISVAPISEGNKNYISWLKKQNKPFDVSVKKSDSDKIDGD